MNIIISVFFLFNLSIFSNKNIEKKVAKKIEIKKEIKKETKKEIKLTAGELAEKIKESYSKVKEIKSDFEQIFYHKAYKRTKKSKGELFFTSDLKMKWKYKTPETKYIISNSKTLWIYEPENEQVFKTKIKGSEIETISKFLAGRLDLFKNYKLKLVNQKTLLLTPKSETSFKSIEITLNGDFKIIKTKMIDNFGNINTIIYKNFKENLNLADSFFEFKIPDNVELIEN